MALFTDAFQLVLQFEAHDLGDFDELVALEASLITELGPACVDGHDVGQGEFNIFLLTQNPVEMFPQVQSVVDARCPGRSFRAAYRPLESDVDVFVILWPPHLQAFSIA